MKEFDKPLKGTLSLEPVDYKRVLFRKAIKSNDRGSKLSIPKYLEGRWLYILVPK